MGVSERSVRYYKQMSEQLTTEEKDDVAEGRLDIKEARERAVERGRETGNIAGSGEKEEKSEKSEKPKQDKLEQAILKAVSYTHLASHNHEDIAALCDTVHEMDGGVLL